MSNSAQNPVAGEGKQHRHNKQSGGELWKDCIPVSIFADTADESIVEDSNDDGSYRCKDVRDILHPKVIPSQRYEGTEPEKPTRTQAV